MSGSEPALICDRDAHIARITFNRPSALNAIDEEMARLFNEACQSVSRDPTVQVVVLRGAGRGFVAGGDLRLFDRDPASVATRLIDPVHEGIATLCAMSTPVLGSVHGIVAGAGVGLALACDLVVAADNTTFNMAYLKVGASCDAGASWSLPRTVGMKKAMEIALLNPVLDAEEARRIGMVNQVVPLSELSAKTDELAARLATESPVAVGHMKRLIRSSSARDLPDQLAAEREAFRECTGTTEFADAVRAFFDARLSRF
jgi:2-(1,2-epoxy-1,2-dihydrophenyl)acetyl-CoA isomerase